jgi:AcrR family transcriptional regulator
MTAKTAIAKERCKQVLRAIDRIAVANALPFLTTQRVARASGVSDGVLFRHFANKDAMLGAWLASRAETLQGLLTAMPDGNYGLHYLVQCLLRDDVLLALLFADPMQDAALRQQMEALREQVAQSLLLRIQATQGHGEDYLPSALRDHLLLSLYRAWNPENPQRAQQKELLMDVLPWEKPASSAALFPDSEHVKQLALNDSGFVFDPINGRSFTANEVGLFVLRALQHGADMEDLLDQAAAQFDVDAVTAERDITEFAAQLRKLLA